MLYWRCNLKSTHSWWVGKNKQINVRSFMAINHSVLWTCAEATPMEKSDASHLKCVGVIVSRARCMTSFWMENWTSREMKGKTNMKYWWVKIQRSANRMTCLHWHQTEIVFLFIAKWTIICGVMNKWCVYSILKVVTNHVWLGMKKTSFSHHFSPHLFLFKKQ